ncbi:hypothetical protein AAFF_G00320740 [Aldrovandia affinis]|uniref:HAT C-terminal dimerisation domain-containing protein n=1 Tax=Aldrovandia affinis TaxID=143900 RepID=A0AAD7VZM3_9TELE|nr:hypothetical protein AAFF_G00320740 [Aldrovandia affinis]
MYDEFVKKKDVKREAYSLGGVQHIAGCSEPPRSSHDGGIAKFERNNPRQVLISEAIAKMIIRDLQAVQIVENKGFQDLLQLLEPRYTPEPCYYIQQQLPGYAYQVQMATKQVLTAAESCSITLDVWRSGSGRGRGRGGGYLGVTCHFITGDWQIKSALLACLPLAGHNTAQHVLSEFEEISHTHGIVGKVFRVVADPFPCWSGFQLPGFCLHGSEEEEDGEEDNSDEEMGAGVGVGMEAVDNSLDLCFGPCRIACFTRTLGLCVREGLRSSPQLSIALTKAACFYNYVTATVPPEKLGQVFGTGGVRAPPGITHGEQCWNWQLKAVRRMLESAEFLEDIVDRHDLTLSSFEKEVLRELVDVMEPFEEATDMVQGDKHVSVSLALPCVLGLRKHLAETAIRQCTGMLLGLAQALDRRLAAILEDPLHVTATALDPQFKLSWSSDIKWHRQVLLKETAKHLQAAVGGGSPQLPRQEPQLPPSKRSKLFSFMKQCQTSQTNSVEQELDTYLHEDTRDEDPLHYWKRKATDFPQLSQVAKKVFTVPATTTPVERIFHTVGKILRPKRCRPLPQNLETLIYLKANYHFLWT